MVLRRPGECDNPTLPDRDILTWRLQSPFRETCLWNLALGYLLHGEVTYQPLEALAVDVMSLPVGKVTDVTLIALAVVAVDLNFIESPAVRGSASRS